jgi:hypothetical protein
MPGTNFREILEVGMGNPIFGMEVGRVSHRGKVSILVGKPKRGRGRGKVSSEERGRVTRMEKARGRREGGRLRDARAQLLGGR